jgi:hypothetical protein
LIGVGSSLASADWALQDANWARASALEYRTQRLISAAEFSRGWAKI